MFEYKCEYCGSVRQYKYNVPFRRFCSKSCALKARHMGVADEEIEEIKDSYPDCVFNQGVACKKRACMNCGWNPVVAMARNKEILGRMGVTV